MCIWSTITYQYIWKMLWTYQYFSFESVHGEAMLKMGWVVKKWIFSFWNTINWSECILMVSVYIWLSIYTNNAILCIIWKFNLSSRGILGRIDALSIEVLYCFDTFNSIPIKRNVIDNLLFTFNWPAVITLIVNTITQSGVFDYTQSARSFGDWTLFNGVLCCK